MNGIPNTRINDFISLMNAFWYRDFPIAETHKPFGSRSEWTTHIGICVRSTADLMGLFTHFESGIRTDAILRDNLGKDIAHIEWEWYQPSRPEVNEIKKLSLEKDKTEFSVFISYSRQDMQEQNLESIKAQWKNSRNPLIVFLVTFQRQGNGRTFKKLETYLVKNGKITHVRSQPALPWEVQGTRWESITK